MSSGPIPALQSTIKISGFTLIELIVTIAVAGILLAIASPQLNAVVTGNRSTAEVNNFVSALNLARGEAVTRGSTVTLCQSSDGAACSAEKAWEKGWIVFTDPDGDGTVDAGEQVLRVYAALGGNVTLRADANFEDFLSYQALGASIGNGGAGSGAFRLCDSRGAAKAYTIAVNNTGRVNSSRGAASCP